MDIPDVKSLRVEFDSIVLDGLRFFEEIKYLTDERSSVPLRDQVTSGRLHDWDFLNQSQKHTAQQVRKRLTELGHRLVQMAKLSPLLEQTDEAEIRRSLRTMCAALLLKSYSYHSPYVVSEEDRVFGIAPAEQEERPADVKACMSLFHRTAEILSEKMDLLAPAPEDFAQAIVASQTPAVQKYRPKTGFIMMQIDSALPKLEDVKNCIKDVFREFGIEAVRSDEIEHSDVITQKILDEIATSEFLIADLTGERPSVYYELGYAHACGKRPILYREEGTRLHFDLLVHNVPEYKNTTDLKAKLRTRLSAMTGISHEQSVGTLKRQDQRSN